MISPSFHRQRECLKPIEHSLCIPLSLCTSRDIDIRGENHIAAVLRPLVTASDMRHNYYDTTTVSVFSQQMTQSVGPRKENGEVRTLWNVPRKTEIESSAIRRLLRRASKAAKYVHLLQKSSLEFSGIWQLHNFSASS